MALRGPDHPSLLSLLKADRFCQADFGKLAVKTSGYMSGSFQQTLEKRRRLDSNPSPIFYFTVELFQMFFARQQGNPRTSLNLSQ